MADLVCLVAAAGFSTVLGFPAFPGAACSGLDGKAEGEFTDDVDFVTSDLLLRTAEVILTISSSTTEDSGESIGGSRGMLDFP